MLPAFTAAGTQDPASLPHAHPCGARWSGANTSHCGACHETFTSVGAFDRHRKGGRCANPAEIGMVHAPGRAYVAWTVGAGAVGDLPVTFAGLRVGGASALDTILAGILAEMDAPADVVAGFQSSI